MAHSRSIIFFLAGALFLCASAAFSQEGLENYPGREVDRPLLLVPGIYELTMVASYIDTREVYNLDGRLESSDDTCRLLDLRFDLGYGITPRLQAGMSLPYLSGETGEAEGAGIGDVSANIYYGLIPEPSAFSAALYLRLSYPSGNHNLEFEWNDEGEKVQTRFITGDPYYDLFPGLALKWQMKDWALEGSLEYVYTYPGEVQVKRGFKKESKDVDPGNGLNAYMSGIYQIKDKLALFLDLRYISRLESEIEDKDDPDDQTMSLSLGPRVLYHISPDNDLYLGTQYVLDGINTKAGLPLYMGIRARF